MSATLVLCDCVVHSVTFAVVSGRAIVEAMVLDFLRAVHTFLGAMANNPNFSTMRYQQFQSCRARLESLTVLTVEAAGAIVAQLGVMNWEAEQLGVLQGLVNGLLPAAGAEVPSRRRANQNYQAFVHYLPESLWLDILGNQKQPADVINSLSHHLTKCGLRLPSEKTFSKVTALMLWGNTRQLSPLERHQAYLQVKGMMKKQVDFLAQNYQNLPFITDLPENPNDLNPAWFRLAFPQGGPWFVPAPIVALHVLSKDFDIKNIFVFVLVCLLV